MSNLTKIALSKKEQLELNILARGKAVGVIMEHPGVKQTRQFSKPTQQNERV